MVLETHTSCSRYVIANPAGWWGTLCRQQTMIFQNWLKGTFAGNIHTIGSKRHNFHQICSHQSNDIGAETRLSMSKFVHQVSNFFQRDAPFNPIDLISNRPQCFQNHSEQNKSNFRWISGYHIYTIYIYIYIQLYTYMMYIYIYIMCIYIHIMYILCIYIYTPYVYIYIHYMYNCVYMCIYIYK